MNRHLVLLILASVASSSFDSSSAQTILASPASAAAPRIHFAETTFDFGKVTSGEFVNHDFLFTNVGSASLTIKEVRSGCGCTTAGVWDKTVEPGKTGKIPLQFNSAAFNGTISKSAAVLCNDPAQSSVLLSMKGTVWKPIELKPTSAVFNLSSDLETNETRVVRIVNNTQDPLELFDLKCTNRAFQAELKTVRLGQEFELRITAVPPITSLPITAPVTFRTSCPQVPSIQVNAYRMLQLPLVVKPEQITLPSGPLKSAVHSIVTIRAYGTNSLVLSDIRVNVPDAVARVQEIQPGRFFSLTVDFPVGFQVQPGRTVELTAQSNQPRLPVLRVPVVHAQSAAPGGVLSAATGIQPTPPKAELPGGK